MGLCTSIYLFLKHRIFRIKLDSITNFCLWTFYLLLYFLILRRSYLFFVCFSCNSLLKSSQCLLQDTPALCWCRAEGPVCLSVGGWWCLVVCAAVLSSLFSSGCISRWWWRGWCSGGRSVVGNRSLLEGFEYYLLLTLTRTRHTEICCILRVVAYVNCRFVTGIFSELM